MDRSDRINSHPRLTIESSPSVGDAARRNTVARSANARPRVKDINSRLNVAPDLSPRMKQLSRRSCAGSDSFEILEKFKLECSEDILGGTFTQICRSSSERSPANSEAIFLLGLKLLLVGGCLDARLSLGNGSETRKTSRSEAAT